MEQSFRWWIGLAMIVWLTNIGGANVFAEEITEEPISTNELLVKYSSDANSTLSARSLLQVEEKETIAPQVELLTFPENMDMDKIKQQLEDDTSIEYVEPNYARELYTTTNDTYFSRQWFIPHIKASLMWPYATNQQNKVVVAVIDSGIDTKHNDLQGRIEQGGYNFYNKNSNITDVDGHGTMVAGVIAASSNNNIGIAGVTGPFAVSILPLKVFHNGGGKTSDIIKAIDYAIEKKSDIINLSLGGTESSKLENEAIQRAHNAGITIVASSGNGALKGNYVNYPASYENVLSVGAVNRYNERSEFSTYNQYVDIVAPGEEIYTTSPYSLYDQVNGTSFSSPIIAGTIAMIKAIKPALSTNEIEYLLENTAHDLGSPGTDSFYGAGVLDIEKLLSQLNFVNKDIAVTGVHLNTNNVFIDLRNKNNSVYVNQNVLEHLIDSRTIQEVMYESEPNNSFLTTNKTVPGNEIVGSITKNYYDLDYYSFNINSNGNFSLLGSWIKSNYIDESDNYYLAIGLYDSKQQLISYADLETQTGDNYQYLSEDLTAGTYYLAVFQASEYKYLFTNERYIISTLFTPAKEPEPELQPTFLLDRAFMQVGQKELFVFDIQPNSVLTSSNPLVATISRDGMIHAVGHGATKITYKSDNVIKEAIIKVTANTTQPTTALFETIVPSNATNKTVKWTSSNPSVANVDEHGIITAFIPGQAIITVTTADGGHMAAATVNIEGDQQPVFVGDFPEMTVSDSKVFTITFNHALEVGKDYSREIKISRTADYSKLINSFTATVNPKVPTQLLVAPTENWALGEHYLMISTGLVNKENKRLNKDTKMKFTIEEESFSVKDSNSLKEYERIIESIGE